MGSLDPNMKKNDRGVPLQCSIHMRNGTWYQVNEDYQDVRDTIEKLIVAHGIKGGSQGFLEYYRLHAGMPMPKVLIRVSEIASVST